MTAPFRMPDEAPATAYEYGVLFRQVLSNPNHLDHARASAEWRALCMQESAAEEARLEAMNPNPGLLG